MTDWITCPHPGCEGAMIVVPGGETERMLSCRTCGEYYYSVGAVACIRCCLPADWQAANALLAAPDGQSLRPEIAERLAAMRRRLGLSPDPPL